MDQSSLELVLSTQSRCDGSATCRVGRSEALAGVFGPLEPRLTQQQFEGALEVSFKAHSVSMNAQEDVDVSLLLKEVIQRCLKLIPRTMVSISVRVMAEEGAGFSCAVVAAAASLVDAGIAMVKFPIGVDVAIMSDDTLVFNPPIEERTIARVRVRMVFCGDEETPSACILSGSCSNEEIENIILASRKYANTIRNHVESALKNHVAKDRDLCL